MKHHPHTPEVETARVHLPQPRHPDYEQAHSGTEDVSHYVANNEGRRITLGFEMLQTVES